MAWYKNAETRQFVASTLKAGVAVSSVALLFACGGDSDNSSKAAADDGREVATLVEMGRCTIEREGDTVYVAEKMTDYLCQDGSWEDLKEISDDEDSLSGTKEGYSSSSKKVNSKSSSSFKYVQDSSAYETPDVVKVKDKSIAGVGQKGPFVTGSVVKLYELDGKTYAQTGKSFTGKITSDNGEFSISSVTLASQYALLEANGYYHNEVRGEKSSGTITLNALTDLSNREKVNVNLLTHLEYERALYLVGTGVNVIAAKKQAEAEIFNAFGIQGDFANSEDLNIFSKGEDNAALLAISVLMQGDCSEAELTELLTKFATDIEKDGEWDDEAAKAKIADWASNQDLYHGLSSIRSHINSLNLGTAPDFEKYVRNYWYANYGLGACNADNEGEIVATTNELSNRYGTRSRYICKNGIWVTASDIEKDTYQWKAGVEGEVKAGSVNKYDYYICYYIYKNGEWRTATALEYDTYGWSAGTDGEVRAGSVNEGCFYVYENGAWRGSANYIEDSLGACVTSREGEVGKSGSWYICKSNTWQYATEWEYDTYGLTGAEGEVKAGKVRTSEYYTYRNGIWQTATTVEKDLGGCTTSREGEVGESGSWYICKSNTWQYATALEYDTYGWSAGTDGEVKAGKVNTSTYYIYKNGKWQTATILEYDTYGLTGAEGDVKAGNVNTSSYYIYKNGKWQTATSVEKDLGGCVASREGEVGKSGSTYYICKSKSWTTASALEYDTYGLTGVEGDVKAGNVNTSSYYIYKNGKWQTATSVEKDLGGCTTSREGEVDKFGSTYYICKSKSWTTATTLEYDTYGEKCISTEVGKTMNGKVATTNKYYCTVDGWVILVGGWSWNVPKEVRLNPEIEYGEMTDTRDGQIYKTVVIGEGANAQTWMAENLNFNYNKGTAKSYCYDNENANCAVTGRLYTWAAAMDSVTTGCGHGVTCSASGAIQGVCPDGWHLPSKAEWETLFTNVGGESTAGTMLKSATGWFYSYDGEDAYGFSALPAGDSGFNDAGGDAFFWFATESSSYEAYYMSLNYYFVNANLGDYHKNHGFSVRCLQNSN